MSFPFNNTYARLPERFYARQLPTPVKQPELLLFNEGLANQLRFKPDNNLAEFFSGNEILAGSEPLAQAYAGHQFGNFVPQLGDGRALLLGEVIDTNAQRYDIQLKGSGQTAFSRGGDGRAALGPVLREYLMGESMHALGIPTTRSLAVVTTGEIVLRETPLPGAILTRVASSHIRIGTFQYFAAQGDWDAVNILYEYARDRHYPDAKTPLEFLYGVITRQANLMAKWLCVGFIHGVMNTDNTSISGETIDYGPCAFMDIYDPQTVFSSIDRYGRYAYANQPSMAQWNLNKLAECLLPLVDVDQDKALKVTQATLHQFAGVFETAWQAGMRRKLGLCSKKEGDADLIGSLLQEMQQHSLDYTNTFRSLYNALCDDTSYPISVDWQQRWLKRLAQEETPPKERLEIMRQSNPAVMPRNHRVEQALDAAYASDLQPFEKLYAALQNPYDDQPDDSHYTQPPMPQERVYQTFCGT